MRRRLGDASPHEIVDIAGIAGRQDDQELDEDGSMPSGGLTGILGTDNEKEQQWSEQKLLQRSYLVLREYLVPLVSYVCIKTLHYVLKMGYHRHIIYGSILL